MPHFPSVLIDFIPQCVFKCKNSGYETYSKLHKHYLDVHRICLHRRVADSPQFLHSLIMETIRVARLDPNNEDEFRKQITSFFALAGGKATKQGYRWYVLFNN